MMSSPCHDVQLYVFQVQNVNDMIVVIINILYYCVLIYLGIWTTDMKELL